MIDLYTSPTPNGWKAAMMLEELELEYTVKLIDLAAGDQHKEWFTKMNPRNSSARTSVRQMPDLSNPSTVFMFGPARNSPVSSYVQA